MNCDQAGIRGMQWPPRMNMTQGCSFLQGIVVVIKQWQPPGGILVVGAGEGWK
jgi:hypothetical protein